MILSAISEVLPDVVIVVRVRLQRMKKQFLASVSRIEEYEKSAVKVIEGAEGVFTHDLLTRDEMNDSPFLHG